MAAPLMQFCHRQLKPFLTPSKSVQAGVLYNQSRGKKHGAGTSGANQGGKTRSKHRGPKKQDGEFVYKGEILHRQLGLVIYPGENVHINGQNTLIAMRDGIVVVSCEKLQPYADSPLYDRVKKGLTIYKKFWNVYPTPIRAKFKLVSES